MKPCPYCGRENSDDATQCRECGTPCSPGQRPLKPAEGWRLMNRPVTQRSKTRLCLAAWGLVILVTAVINYQYLLGAPLFPIGLLALLPQGEEKAIIAGMIGIPAALAGWLFYALLGIAMNRTKRGWVFVVIYLFFILALALNVVGCQRTFHAAEGIH